MVTAQTRRRSLESKPGSASIATERTPPYVENTWRMALSSIAAGTPAAQSRAGRVERHELVRPQRLTQDLGAGIPGGAAHRVGGRRRARLGGEGENRRAAVLREPHREDIFFFFFFFFFGATASRVDASRVRVARRSRTYARIAVSSRASIGSGATSTSVSPPSASGSGSDATAAGEGDLRHGALRRGALRRGALRRGALRRGALGGRFRRRGGGGHRSCPRPPRGGRHLPRRRGRRGHLAPRRRSGHLLRRRRIGGSVGGAWRVRRARRHELLVRTRGSGRVQGQGRARRHAVGIRFRVMVDRPTPLTAVSRSIEIEIQNDAPLPDAPEARAWCLRCRARPPPAGRGSRQPSAPCAPSPCPESPSDRGVDDAVTSSRARQ